jgi:hypothetical protein
MALDINVKLRTEELTRFAEALSPAEIAKATSRAINFALLKTRTQLKKSIANKYKIPSNSLASKSLVILRAAPIKPFGTINADSRPESLGHFNPSQIVQTSTGHTSVRKRKGAYGKQEHGRKSGKSGVYVEVVKGRKENLPSAFILLISGKPIVMARGVYKGHDGFQWAQGGRLPLTKLNTKSVYWASQHEKVFTQYAPMTREWYGNELWRQLQGAIKFGN